MTTDVRLASVRSAITTVEDLDRLRRMEPNRSLRPGAWARWDRAMRRGAIRKRAAVDTLRELGFEPPGVTTGNRALLVYLRSLMVAVDR